MKHLTLFILVVAVFATVLSSSAFAEEKPLVKCTVADVEGKPVKGAYIFFYDSADTKRAVDLVSPVTDEQGYCEKSVPSGTYWLVARLKREGSFDMGPLMIEDKVSADLLELTVSPGEVVDLEFTVMDLLDTIRTSNKKREDLNLVSGRVVDSNGEPLKRVFVFANRNDKPVLMPRYFSAWTGEDGRFKVYMPDGKYFLGVSGEFAPGLKYKAFDGISVSGKNLVGVELVFNSIK